MRGDKSEREWRELRENTTKFLVAFLSAAVIKHTTIVSALKAKLVWRVFWVLINLPWKSPKRVPMSSPTGNPRVPAATNP